MQVDVVIAGAGIAGLSVAWHLREAGVRRIAVIERRGAGTGATGHGAGFLSHFTWNELDAHLIRRSAELYRVFDAETGAGFFRTTGSYVLAGRPWRGGASETGEDAAGGNRRHGPASGPGISSGITAPGGTGGEAEEEAVARVVAALEERVAMLRREGIAIEALTPEEGAAALPAWNWSDVARAWFLPDDGTLLPAVAARELARVLRDRGVIVLEENPIQRLAIQPGRRAVEGVYAAEGRVAADVVVVATGVWTRQLLHTAGLDVPLKAYRTQLSFWQVPPELDDAAIPPLHDVSGEFYWLRREGMVAVGDGTQLVEQDPEDFRREPDPDFVESARQRLVHRCPAAREAEFVRGWAHLCDATPDRRPLLGPYGGVAGLHLAVGFNGFGVMRAPAVGELVARFVLDEEPRLGTGPALDPAPVRADRFDGFFDFEMGQGFNTHT